MSKFPKLSSSYLVLLQEEKAVQVMEVRSVILPNADGSEAREAHSSHLDRMGLTTPLSEDQAIAGNVQQMARDHPKDNADELEQRLTALNLIDNSPSKSSNASFKTAREQTSPTKPSQKALGKRKEEKSPAKPDPVTLPPAGSILQSTTITQTSTRATTSHPASATQGSTAPTSQVSSASSSKREPRAPASTRPSSRRVTTGPDASAASSRRSSFLISPPTASQTIGPVRKHRRSNTTWPPPPAPTSVANPKQALQSLQTFSDLRDDVLSGMQAEERAKFSSSLPTLPRPTTANTPAAAPDASSPDENPQTPQEYSNHVRAANIDWTLPSTRRREYEKIDKARRGIRGLLRRVTPRFLLKNGRVGFHDAEDGKGSDAGTVRRFRMDVEDDDSVVVGGEEEEEDAKGKWWKSIGKKMKGGKGKKKDESSAEA